MNKPFVSIVIPAYNEEKRIGKTLDVFGEFFEKIRRDGKIEYELLVVINNTKDRTEEIVKENQRNNSRIRYLNFKRGGKGFAVIEGFKDALKRKNDLIGFVDADLATSPKEFYRLIEHIGNYDGIIASRYVAGAVIKPKPSLQRLLAKKAFNILVRFLLLIPYRDTQCGAKVFKRRTVQEFVNSITMSQWAFDVDLLYTARKKSFKIREFPTMWADKEYSKINFWRAGPGMAIGVVRLRILNSPYKGLLKIYDKFNSKK